MIVEIQEDRRYMHQFIFTPEEQARIDSIRLRRYLMANERDRDRAEEHFGLMPHVQYVEDVAFLLQLLGIQTLKK